jgi:quaternary ammonium compound-resistance protein SugE
VGLKFAWRDDQLYLGPAAAAVLCMALSGLFLFLAQRTIPMGTAYAVWTGIGAAGTVIAGIVLLSEPASALRLFFIGMVAAGIIGLKMTSAQ